MGAALRFFVLLEVLGLAATPLAAAVFARLPWGSGVAFAKPLGLLLVGWLVWIGGSVHVVPNGVASAVGGVVVVAGLGAVVWWRVRPAVPRAAFVWSEALGAAAFAAMALLVAYSPDVWQTEKPMDMAFLNAANESRFFPPHDPWMAGEDLNYYYLGHLMAGVLVRLSAVDPDVGYNLSVAAYFALSVVAAFGLAAAAGGHVRAGLWGVALCVVLGTVGGGVQLLDHGGPLRDYDWFGATRVIDGTINEFPAFSFLLADLHGHVMAIPFSLLALALGLQLAVSGPPRPPRGPAALELAVTAIAVGTLYAINAWSAPVIGGLVALGIVLRLREPLGSVERARTLAWGGAALGLAVIAGLPFLIGYDAAADGLGWVDERASFAAFARDHGNLYGLLLFLAAIALAVRMAGSRHPWRNAAWVGVAAIVVGSLLAPADLAGVALLAVLVAVGTHAALSRRLAAGERFTWVLVAGGLLCLLLPELVYVRDSFEGGELYRMNTVFKLGYQAWLLLAIAGASVVVAAPGRIVWTLPMVALLALAAVYPVAGTYARKDGFSRSPTLDGLRWLEPGAPGDPEAMAWLRDNAERAAVVLEAVGDDYSAFGHARISTFTGLPTILGWPGHEVQWDHDPGTRRRDVEQLYRARDAAAARPLLQRYGVRYVVVGPLERADYGDAGVAKWDTLGQRVFDREGTTVWRLL